jgi:hypothetical protein
MTNERCQVQGCGAQVYAPGGTGSLCKEHFIQFVNWRRRRGPGMFQKYAAMSMENRDAIVAEWKKTVTVAE